MYIAPVVHVPMTPITVLQVLVFHLLVIQVSVTNVQCPIAKYSSILQFPVMLATFICIIWMASICWDESPQFFTLWMQCCSLHQAVFWLGCTLAPRKKLKVQVQSWALNYALYCFRPGYQSKNLIVFQVYWLSGYLRSTVSTKNWSHFVSNSIQFNFNLNSHKH